MAKHPAKNVLGGPLQSCSQKPKTGFYRDGCCNTGDQDRGVHTVCAVMSEGFLSFSRSRGNDLSTPSPQYEFPGLKPGDRWCLCASRLREAIDAGQPPKVVLAATHERTLEHVSLEELFRLAVDLS